MKNIKKAKLQIDRDVLRILTANALRDVEGGNAAPGTSGCSTPRSPCGSC